MRARFACKHLESARMKQESPPAPRTHASQLKRIKDCYGNMPVKEIFGKIIGAKAGALPYAQLLVSADSDTEDGSDPNEENTPANPVGVTGKQGGKLLASFLLSERENAAFAVAFQNGILPWLQREQPKYNLHPSTKILWAETIRYLPILEARLARAQRAPVPMPDFDSPGSSSQHASQPPPMPNFG